MWRQLIEIKPTNRGWHLPVLAGFSVGIPLLGGYALGHLQEGKLAAFAGLVILYLHNGSFASRMLTLMACSLGLTLSFAAGQLLSFHPVAACVALAIIAFLVHLALYAFRLFHPPGNFFFIMIASLALCMPFAPEEIVTRIGLVAIGTMISCSLGLVYALISKAAKPTRPLRLKSRSRQYREAVLFGVFAGASLTIGLLLKFKNPYWVPTSCLAVMQGASASHVSQRGIQRIVGTLLGLLLTWLILLLHPGSLTLCLAIVAIQVLVELLISRNYGLAVIFLTVMTIFLAEPTASLSESPGELIRARFLDILTGSALACSAAGCCIMST